MAAYHNTLSGWCRDARKSRPHGRKLINHPDPEKRLKAVRSDNGIVQILESPEDYYRRTGKPIGAADASRIGAAGRAAIARNRAQREAAA